MRRLAVPCAILLLLGGCNGDDSEEPRGAVTVDPRSTVRVTADEYSFDPDRVVVRGPGPLTIRLRNAGELAHDLRVGRGGGDIGGTAVLAAGDSGLGQLSLQPGRWEIFCSIGDHAELGMTGELEVR
jgi:plastocyanin